VKEYELQNLKLPLLLPSLIWLGKQQENRAVTRKPRDAAAQKYSINSCMNLIAETHFVIVKIESSMQLTSPACS